MMELDKSLKLTQFAVDHAVDTIYWIDSEGKFCYVNQAASKMLGYTRSELQKMSVQDINPSVDDEEWATIWESVHEVGSFSKESHHRHKDGRLIPVEVTANALQFGDNRVICSFVRDITDRVEAVSALQQSERQLREIHENAAEGIYRTDLEGNILYCNQAMAKILGFENAEEILQHSVYDLFNDPDDRDSLVAKLQRHDSLRDNEVLMKRKDGKKVWVRENGVAVRNEEGVLQYIEGFMFDITNSKQFEFEIQKTQKLESMAVLTAGIAHDYNNFLASMSLSISSAKLLTNGNEELQDLLHGVEQSIKGASSMTRQLSAFSKESELRYETIAVEPFLRESVNFALHGSPVTPVFNISHDLLKVNIDPGQIAQVLRNLVLNAIQSMPDGGQITVGAINEDIEKSSGRQVLQPGKYVRISVKDEGVGIDPQNLDKIFDPYFTSKQEGTGLGLFASYNIVSRHKGVLFASSEAGKGSLFAFCIPALEDQALQEVLALIQTVPPSRILVIESDKQVSETLGKLLTNMGHSVDLVADGEKAIDHFIDCQISAAPCDVILIDSRLRGKMDYSAVYNELKAISPGIRGVLISADPELSAPDPDLRFDGFLPKPFTSFELEKVLQDVIRMTDIRLA